MQDQPMMNSFLRALLRFRLQFLVLGMATMAMVAGCSVPGAAQGNLLQQVDLVLRQGQPNGTALALAPESARIGQRVAMRVRSPEAGYLYVVQLDSEGRSLSLVFPNAQDDRNAIAPGEVLLPRAGWQLTSRGPAGVAYLVAIVTREAQDMATLNRELGNGRIQLRGPYAAAMAPLQEHAP